jgi:hypothetical protein
LLIYIALSYRSLGNAEKERVTQNAYGTLGDKQKSRELLERAFAIKQRHYCLEHPKVINKSG